VRRRPRHCLLCDRSLRVRPQNFWPRPPPHSPSPRSRARAHTCARVRVCPLTLVCFFGGGGSFAAAGAAVDLVLGRRYPPSAVDFRSAEATGCLRALSRAHLLCARTSQASIRAVATFCCLCLFVCC
jgi:hypothetical protein